jgi:hypothetical protein
MDISTDNFSWMVALGIFSVYFFIDILYANYTLMVVERRAKAAASVSAVMYFLLALGVLTYISNALYLIPLFLGAWLGTYVAVRHHRDPEH